MEWVRGQIVGRGSFGTVNLAKPRSRSTLFPPLMAVKSSAASLSASLVNERCVLQELNDCPQIVRCLGGDFSFENGEKLYNVLLEYASGGALADKLRNSGTGRLSASDVRRYTKSLLKGLHYVHKNGYVHCDLKLQNILLFSRKDVQEDDVKIADFGLAKKAGAGREKAGMELRGTPLYMSPEMVAAGEQEAPADVWALGCLVAEMAGAEVWRFPPGADVCGLLMRIGVGEEVPEIPGKLSAEGRDFLGKCFIKDQRKRWTAEMLLNHPFVVDENSDHDDTVPLEETCEPCSTSPRAPFDFPDCDEQTSSTFTFTPSPEYSSEQDTSPAEKLRPLVTGQIPDWPVSDSWITVRWLLE